MMVPDVVNHALGSVQVGLGIYKRILEAVNAAIPDGATTIDDVIAEDDKVVVRMTLRGTHRRSTVSLLDGIEATGRPVEWQFIHIFRLHEGKIVEHWAQRNDLEVRRHLQDPQGGAA